MTHGFTVMTFNIRYDTDADGRQAWAHRRDLALALIRDRDPDLLGVQEASGGQWTDIAAALPGWTPFGRAEFEPVEGYDDGPCGFVRSARFERREAGVFWLSDTPDVAGSITWPNDFGARMCCWARLHDRTANRALIFATTHFDTNAGGWLRSAQALRAELDAIAGATPIIVAGDFNCAAGSAAHAYLCAEAGYRDAWNEAGHGDEGVITFNGFMPGAALPGDAEAGNERIDWILVRGGIGCGSAAIDDRTAGGLLPSDHYPVIARLELIAP